MAERMPSDAEAKMLRHTPDPLPLHAVKVLCSCIDEGWMSFRRRLGVWQTNESGRAALARWQKKGQTDAD